MDAVAENRMAVAEFKTNAGRESCRSGGVIFSTDDNQAVEALSDLFSVHYTLYWTQSWHHCRRVCRKKVESLISFVAGGFVHATLMSGNTRVEPEY